MSVWGTRWPRGFLHALYSTLLIRVSSFASGRSLLANKTYSENDQAILMQLFCCNACMNECMLLFQECLRKGGFNQIAPLRDAGVVDAVVASLQHDSPFCVAAAARALGAFGVYPQVGKAIIEASGAIPALVHVIQRSPSPGDLAKAKGLFRRYVAEEESPCSYVCSCFVVGYLCLCLSTYPSLSLWNAVAYTGWPDAPRPTVPAFCKPQTQSVCHPSSCLFP